MALLAADIGVDVTGPESMYFQPPRRQPRPGWRGRLCRRCRIFTGWSHRLLGGEWDWGRHGSAVNFVSWRTGEILDVQLGYGDEFGVLNPYFFWRYCTRSAGLQPVARLLGGDDGSSAGRVLEMLARFGHLIPVRRVDGFEGVCAPQASPPLDVSRARARTAPTAA